MEFQIHNGAVEAHTYASSPRCVSIDLHLSDREVEANATHAPARGKDHEHGEREAYICLTVKAGERDYEIPKNERDSRGFPLSRRCSAVEQHTFLDIEQARAIVEALSAAIACAEVK